MNALPTLMRRWHGSHGLITGKKRYSSKTISTDQTKKLIILILLDQASHLLSHPKKEKSYTTVVDTTH